MRGAAPGSGILARSPICRYRREAPRHIASQWSRGGAGAVVRALGISSRCHRAHDGTGAPATSWPATARATDGLKQVMSATGGFTTHLGSWQGRGQSSRYRQKPAGTPGRTTKPPIFESLIALRPAGSAFFSLVFFADAKKSDRQPPQGDVVWLLGAKTSAAKRNSDQPQRPMSYGPQVQKPTPQKETATITHIVFPFASWPA